MAAAAAVVAQRRAAEKRRQAQQAKEDARSFVKDTLQRFDKDHSGGLKWNEVKAFLEALQAGKRDGDLSVCEIKWVIQEAIKSTETDEEWEKWANGSKQLLTELNAGVAPTELEVARVLRHAERNPPDVGAISKPGLIKALAEWYAIEEEKKPEMPSSSCCVLC